ncbi:outer membrane beta-barrel protein [Barnesiella sp. An55]|uniref:outer membrane beta-barrel protein n=1 Tax=Barnesiella sp. An55 TaxID=1965646 RepID=UPI000B36D0A2|nr:outer membrane beta-barrel protein [Barnesiella sp. An55]OUN74312.1 hypothetical protein B5G10_01745 [Barnesiella sp. An55]
MKKSILTLIILFIGSLSASAQWSSAGNDTGNSTTSYGNNNKPAGGFIRVGGAVSFNTLGGSYFEDQTNVSGKTTGIISLCQVGGYFGKNKNFYAGLGVELPFKGWKEEVEINGRTMTTTYNTMGYRIPIFIGYNYRFTPKVSLYVQTGINFDFDFAGYWGTIEYNGEKQDLKDTLPDEYFNIFNSSWAVQAGVVLHKIHLGLNYSLPYTDIFNHKHVADDINGRLGAVNLYIGLAFDLK